MALLLVLNGATGAWDELAIALVALGVLWLGVKLAGRKQAAQDDDDAGEDFGLEKERKHPAPPPD